MLVTLAIAVAVAGPTGRTGATGVADVNCLNCNDDGWLTTVSLIAAIVAVVIALWSLIYSARMHKMARIEHSEFLNELNRHPKFDFDVHWYRGSKGVSDDGMDLEVTATTTYSAIDVRVHNDGSVVAKDTTVNIHFPKGLYLKRDTDQGMQDVRKEPLDDPLPIEGGEVPSELVSWQKQDYAVNVWTVHRFRTRVERQDYVLPVRVKVIESDGTTWPSQVFHLTVTAAPQ